jgi:hypothetical protein
VNQGKSQFIGKVRNSFHVFGYHPAIVYKNVKPPRNATKQHKEKGKTIVRKNKVKRKCSDLPVSWSTFTTRCLLICFLEAFLDALFPSTGAPPLDSENVAEECALA